MSLMKDRFPFPPTTRARYVAWLQGNIEMAQGIEKARAAKPEERKDWTVHPAYISGHEWAIAHMDEMAEHQESLVAIKGDQGIAGSGSRPSDVQIDLATKGERRYTTVELRVFGEPLAVLNEGRSRLYVDDGCYVLFNDSGAPEGSWKMSSWLFPDAVAVLSRLHRLGSSPPVEGK